MRRKTRSRRTATRSAALAAGLLAAPNLAAALTLSGTGLTDGGRLPSAQVGSSGGCHGANRAPALAWSGVPARTHSLAVTLFDPDAGGGRGFRHWALIDLPPKMRALPAGARAVGEMRVGRNDFGTLGYGGACPPPGTTHRYVFTVWALPEKHAPFGNGTSDEAIAVYLETHALAHASLTLRYGR